MKTFSRPLLVCAALAGCCANANAHTAATTATTPPARSASTAPAAETTTAAPATAANSRFSTFDTASSAVQTAVSQAQSIATNIRTAPVQGSTQTMIVGGTTLAGAVSTAAAAIVQDGRVARADVLAERQAALTRLRLAQTHQDRRRLVEELRTQVGQRMEEQRELARLVRDRLRELRDTTIITPRPGG